MEIISAYDAKQLSVSGALIFNITSKLAKANKLELVSDFTVEIANSFNELKLFISDLIQNSKIQKSTEKPPSIKDESIIPIESPINNNNVPNLGYPYLSTSQNDEENPNLKFPKFYKCDINNCNKIFNNINDKLNHQCPFDILNIQKDDKIIENNPNIVHIPVPHPQVTIYLFL
jgi:hypothetical protein